MKVESKPERLTREVKEVALKSGASLVGIVLSARYLMYMECQKACKYGKEEHSL